MRIEGLVRKLVNRYIGVEGGYLGLPAENRFTYRNHTSFYPEYCDLDNKFPDLIEGTTQKRFCMIFTIATPREQAKIIKGVIERFPLGEGPKSRTVSLKEELLADAALLETQDYIPTPIIEFTSEVVFEALKDAEVLIQNRKALSAVDRVHTAFHGYLHLVCKKEGILSEESDDLVTLVKKINEQHQKIQNIVGVHQIKNILRSLVSIADSLNPVRNNTSLAHPNESLLDDAEAMLIINTVRTVMIYLERRLM